MALTSVAPGRPALHQMCSKEPYRIFFPLGLLAGITGLVLWPLFLLGIWKTYPLVVHSRLMVEGFLGAFILGFLGTAGPRLLNAPHFTLHELAALVALHAGSIGLHFAGRTVDGDILFLCLLISFAAILGTRLTSGGEIPSPNFILVGFGILGAIAGTALTLLGTVIPSAPRLYSFGGLLLNQGFVLLPVIGVGAFLFPRFLGVPFGAELAELRKMSPLWRRRAWIATGTGCAIIASFILETFGYLRGAGALRLCATAAYIVSQMPSVLQFGRAPFLGQCIRVATWILLLGLAWPIFLPAYRVAGLHLVFIGGFMLATFTVATRVILAHSGQAERLRKPLPFSIAAGVLLLVGMAARIGADFVPSVGGRNAHLLYGALLCVAAALIWGIRLVPRVLIPSPED